MSNLVLGLVPYLNILPLIEGLDSVYPRDRWVRATPRELSKQLHEGEVDIALLSIIEGIVHPDQYQLIPGAAIGSNGPVRSVKLYSQLPIHQIKTVLLDRASLTSINLMKILLAERYDLDPVYSLSPDPISIGSQWQSRHDAVVVIGDTALAWENQFPVELDAGAEWKDLTGLPFVFAGWLARIKRQLSKEELEAFAKARGRGLSNLRQLVDRLPLSVQDTYGGKESLYQYFSAAISYELHEEELKGIRLFTRKLVEHQLIGEKPGELKIASLIS